jgi:hypothetical protein
MRFIARLLLSVTARPIKRTAKWLVTKMPLLAPEFD